MSYSSGVQYQVLNSKPFHEPFFPPPFQITCALFLLVKGLGAQPFVAEGPSLATPQPFLFSQLFPFPKNPSAFLHLSLPHPHEHSLHAAGSEGLPSSR